MILIHWLTSSFISVCVFCWNKIKMADPNRYRRLKKLNFCQLKSVKNERNGQTEQMLPGDRPVEGLFVLTIAVELVKDLYFASHSTDLTTRLLYGDISPRKDQRLFNLIMASFYIFMILQFYLSRFKGQKARFFQLSQFLLGLNLETWSKRFLVPKRFVAKFTKEMNFLAGICPFLVNGLVVLT